MNLLSELRRRRVFRMTGLYIVGAWLALQVAEYFFAAWGLDETNLRFVIIATFLALPVVIVFSWRYDITSGGIKRTAASDLAEGGDFSLKTGDYLVLVCLVLIAGGIAWKSFQNISVDLPVSGEQSLVTKLPNSIAILPYKNLSIGTDLSIFGEGVAEAILFKLAAIEGLTVIGRASSFAFGTDSVPVNEISDALGAKFILQGSVIGDEKQVIVRSMLLDENGAMIWSDEQDNPVGSILRTQASIAESVADALIQYVSPEPLNPTPDVDREAYLDYLLGRSLIRDRARDWQQQALAAFDRSISRDPGFGPAYAGKAIIMSLRRGSRHDTDSDDSYTRSVLAVADTALRLDPGSAEAHAARGMVFMNVDPPDNVAAEEEFRQAIALNPALIEAYNWLAIALSSQGRREEADRVEARARALDPLNPILNINLALNYIAAGQYEAAEGVLARLQILPEQPVQVMRVFIQLNNQRGSYDLGIRLLNEEIAEEGRESILRFADDLYKYYRALGMDHMATYYADVYLDSVDDPVQRLLIEELYTCTEHHENCTSQTLIALEAYFADNGIDIDKTPWILRREIGDLYIQNGDYQKGIHLLESVIDPDAPLSSILDWGTWTLGSIQHVAYAYLELGDKQPGLHWLNAATAHLDRFAETRVDSAYDIMRARDAILRNEHAEAKHHFEVAIQNGFMDLYLLDRDVMTREVFMGEEFAEFREVLERKIAAQRTRVESWGYGDIPAQDAGLIQR